MTLVLEEVQAFNQALCKQDQSMADELAKLITQGLPRAKAKIWHRHPVWFLEGNPIVGYSRLKAGMRLMFWSGQSFEEDELKATGSFKASEIIYTSKDQIEKDKIERWLRKAEEIQWDYKNIVKRKGRLEPLK